MNNVPRDLKGLLAEELEEARKTLRWAELTSDAMLRQEGYVEGLQLGIEWGGDQRRLAGVAAGLVRVAELCGRAPSALRVIKGGYDGLEGEQKA